MHIQPLKVFSSPQPPRSHCECPNQIPSARRARHLHPYSYPRFISLTDFPEEKQNTHTHAHIPNAEIRIADGGGCGFLRFQRKRKTSPQRDERILFKGDGHGLFPCPEGRIILAYGGDVIRSRGHCSRI